MKRVKSLRVGVVFGGRSGEHQVSLKSAQNVMEALTQAGHHVVPMGITPQGAWLTTGDPFALLSGKAEQRPFPMDAPINGDAASEDLWALLPHAAAEEPPPGVDVLFPVLHGTYGEDGTIQGLFEMANLPYVGCGVLASATGMDKIIAKQLFAQAGLPQLPYIALLRRRWRAEPETVLAKIEAQIDYPCFVKPANLGSSVGISRAETRAEAVDAIDLASRFDRRIVVEAAMPHAREIEVSVLGNDDPIASVPGEIVPGNAFYDYAAKYLNDNSALLIPAPLSDAEMAQVQAMAVQAFRAVDGSGLARADFLMNGDSGEIVINEINTMPGFTRISMYPKLWQASGISYPELVDKLLHLALERHADRQENSTSFEC